MCSDLSTLPQSAVEKTAEISTALEVLHSVFGYQSFRKGQQEVIQAALSGQDSLVVMATGNGKSLCYQIPALCFDGLTLVISPHIVPPLLILWAEIFNWPSALIVEP